MKKQGGVSHEMPPCLHFAVVILLLWSVTQLVPLVARAQPQHFTNGREQWKHNFLQPHRRVCGANEIAHNLQQYNALQQGKSLSFFLRLPSRINPNCVSKKISADSSAGR